MSAEPVRFGWPDPDDDECLAETPGNCRGCDDADDAEHGMCDQEGRLLHARQLAGGHEGRHVCCCGRNWA